MPVDVLALATGKSAGCSLVDYLELDLIDFLLHYKNNRVISIIGTVGVGKSTFIKHVLGNVRALCPSLHLYFPAIVNCLYIGSKNPLFQDILYDLIRAVREAMVSMPNPEALDIDRVGDLISSTQINSLNNASSSHIIEFVTKLNDVCGLRNLELIVVFDNVDHLSPASVTEIVELARALHMSTGVSIITTMRPATHAIQSEVGSGRGAFHNFLIEITPPDIRSVIRRRLNIAFNDRSNRRVKLGTALGLEVIDPKRSINSLCDKVLNPRTQEVYLRDLCNNNVRRALVSFERFFRYRDLKYHLLFDTRSEPAEMLHGTWFDHLIDGLMIADLDMFEDGKGPISNILFFGDDGEFDYLVLYLTLSITGWSGRPFVRLRTLGDWLEKFGYDWSVSRVVIDHLLQRNLLFCPESESTIKGARNLRLSYSGEYFLKYLLENPQYLINVIYDVPLPHANWQEGDSDAFAIRMNSIWELIDAVYADERVLLERMLARPEQIEALGAIDYGGFLSGRLCKGALRLTKDAHFARSDGTRTLAREYEQRLNQIAADVAASEAILRSELARRKLIPAAPVSVETIEASMGGNNLVRLIVPSQLAPAKHNSVAIEVEMEGVEEAHPIVALWQANLGGVSYGEIVELKRSAGALYRGGFALSDVAEITAFPKSSVTLFCATDPISITRMHGSTNRHAGNWLA